MLYGNYNGTPFSAVTILQESNRCRHNIEVTYAQVVARHPDGGVARGGGRGGRGVARLCGQRRLRAPAGRIAGRALSNAASLIFSSMGGIDAQLEARKAMRAAAAWTLSNGDRTALNCTGSGRLRPGARHQRKPVIMINCSGSPWPFRGSRTSAGHPSGWYPVKKAAAPSRISSRRQPSAVCR